MKFLTRSIFLVGFVSFFAILPATNAQEDVRLLGAWLFDEGLGKLNRVATGILKDSSGNGHDGEIVGSPKWRWGKYGAALQFGLDPDDNEGTGWSYIKVPYHQDLDLSKFTFTAWIKVSAAIEPLQMIINREVNPDLRNYALWIRTPGDGELGGQGDSGHFACAIGSTFPAVKHIGVKKTRPVTDNQWHFVACSFDGLTMTAYIDGKKEAAEENKVDQGLRPRANKPKGAPLLIGARALHGWEGNERPFVKGVQGVAGLIDEVALFDSGLSAEEIKGVMEMGLTGKYEFLAVNRVGKLATTWASLKANKIERDSVR